MKNKKVFRHSGESRNPGFVDPGLKHSGMTRIFYSIFLLLFILSTSAYAEIYTEKENYLSKSGEKLGRGFTNIAISPLEITKPVERDLKAGHTYKPFLVAPFEGIAKMFGRIGIGAYELATFVVPQDPILHPPYVTPNIQEFIEEKHHEERDGFWAGLYPPKEKYATPEE